MISVTAFNIMSSNSNAAAKAKQTINAKAKAKADATAKAMAKAAKVQADKDAARARHFARMDEKARKKARAKSQFQMGVERGAKIKPRTVSVNPQQVSKAKARQREIENNIIIARRNVVKARAIVIPEVKPEVKREVRRTTVKGKDAPIKSRRVSVNIDERVKYTWTDAPVRIKPVVVKAPKPVAVKVTKRKRKYTAGSNAGAIRGRKYGEQAQHFGENGIRGNYFSDYVMDKISRNAKYERYVNGRDRIDAFAVVNGVAHIVEFKTGGLQDRVYMEQVLRYAKGIRDEGYSNIKITMLYSDNRSHNKSWKVNMATLDADHARVSPKSRA